MMYTPRATHQTVATPFDASHNAALLAEFRIARASEQVRRSHFFGDRFENLYLPEAAMPALSPVLRFARQAAQSHLGLAALPRLGFWFNEMAPGQRTLPHTHDDDDELLSGVYYVEAPDDSGDLLLGAGAALARVVPRAGRLILFAPDLIHEVGENRSGRIRLSIGMNFGPPEPD